MFPIIGLHRQTDMQGLDATFNHTLLHTACHVVKDCRH